MSSKEGIEVENVGGIDRTTPGQTGNVDIVDEDDGATGEDISRAEAAVVDGSKLDLDIDGGETKDPVEGKLHEVLDGRDGHAENLARLQATAESIRAGGVELDPDSETARAIREETEQLFERMDDLNAEERELLFGEDTEIVSENAENGTTLNSDAVERVLENYEEAGGSQERMKEMRQEYVDKFIESIDEFVETESSSYFSPMKNGERAQTILIAALKRGVEIQSKDFVEGGGEPAFGFQYEIEGAEFKSPNGEDVSYITGMKMKFGCYEDENGQLVWPPETRSIDLSPLRKREREELERMEKGVENNTGTV
jgi:hypothetical protein